MPRERRGPRGAKEVIMVFDREDVVFQVVVNHEEQYSI